MKYPNRKRIAVLVMTSMMACAMLLMPASRIDAADHRDGPRLGAEHFSIDIDDLYLFLDPNDNTKVILAFDVAAPIIPAENANAGFFDSAANFRLQIDNRGDALAWTALKAGKQDQAQSAIKEALRLGTRDAKLFYHAGMIALAREDKAAVRDYLNRALAINPQFDPLQVINARKALDGLSE